MQKMFEKQAFNVLMTLDNQLIGNNDVPLITSFEYSLLSQSEAVATRRYRLVR